MCLRASFVASLMFLYAGLAIAQDEAPAAQPPKAEGGLHDTRPLSPAQQRDRDIRVYDPFDKSTPAPVREDGAGPDGATVETPRAPIQGTAPAPPPGSAKASNELAPKNPRSSGPQVIADDPDLAPVQEYTGPAVLSRSYTISRPMTPRQVKWSPELGISGLYDTGLTGGKINPDGSLANIDAFGTSLSWGLTGRHFWKHDQAGLDYRGSYNHYNSSSGYNGSNQFLNADFSHEFSRRLVLNLVESGSITNQSNALVNQFSVPGSSPANLDLAASPSTQILDQGMRQFTSMMDLTWRKSARLSVNFGGGYFAVDRTGAGLLGNTGYQARADVNYRYTRKMTIGAYYSFTDYTFTKHIQISNADTFGGIFSYALARRTQIRLRAGVTRAESEGLTTVAIDPAIAALIGRGTAIVDEYHLMFLSDISAEVVKDFGRSRTGNISYTRGIAPGNGLLLTSVQETESGAFSMTVLHHYKASAGAGHTKLSSAGQSIGLYETTYATFGLGRTYNHGLGTNFQMDYRRFSLSSQPILHSQFRISTGITWGPGDEKLW
jgi:hypothetical protein